MTERVEEIRRRHEEFVAQYSPGPDWEPCNQMSLDRGWLLAALAQAERERDVNQSKYEQRIDMLRADLDAALAEAERLTHLHNLDHSLVNQREADLARVRAVAEWAKNHRSRDCDCAALAEFARAALEGR